MNLSLRTRVSLFITVLVVLLSGTSTVFFTVAHRRTAEREIDARGTALVQTLARAAARGLVAEDLDLLRQASYVVQAPDVRSLQIFSSIWEPVDAYPFDDLKRPPASAGRRPLRGLRGAAVPEHRRPPTISTAPSSTPRRGRRPSGSATRASSSRRPS